MKYQVSRTTASRTPSGSVIAIIVVVTSAFAAAYEHWSIDATIVAIIVTGFGGLVAGAALRIGHPRSARVRFLVPVVGVAPVALLMVGALESDSDALGLLVATGMFLIVSEVTAALGYVAADQWMDRRSRPAAVVAELSNELVRATDGGRIPIVIREYVDDESGRRRLAEDRAALAANGYVQVTEEHHQVTPGELAVAAAAIVVGGGDVTEPTIVVTYRLAGALPTSGATVALVTQGHVLASRRSGVVGELWSLVAHAGFVLLAVPVGCGVLAGTVLASFVVVVVLELIVGESGVFMPIMPAGFVGGLGLALAALVRLYRAIAVRDRGVIELPEPGMPSAEPDIAPTSHGTQRRGSG